MHNISISDNECLNKCDGLFITGFERREFEQEQVEEILSNIMDDYELYKSGSNLTDSTKFGGACNSFNINKFIF